MAAASSDVGAAPDLQDVIDDLALRFVINCPPEEQESFERLLFQVEAAYWFYDDNYREIWPNVFPNHTLLGFTETMFRKCELLKPYQSKTKDIFEAFRKYRSQIPTCGDCSLTRPISPICHTPIFPIYHEHLFRGAMLINESRTKVLCVKGWKAQSWGFPKGKMDRDEDQVCCATREVLEEVGFDISKKVRAFFLFFSLFFSFFLSLREVLEEVGFDISKKVTHFSHMSHPTFPISHLLITGEPVLFFLCFSLTHLSLTPFFPICHTLPILRISHGHS